MNCSRVPPLPTADGCDRQFTDRSQPRLAPKVLAPHAPNGQGNIYIVQHHSVADEIQTIANYIDWYLHQNPGFQAGEVLSP